MYTSEILDGGNRPVFRVTADDTDKEFVDETPSGAWSKIVKKVNKLKGIFIL